MWVARGVWNRENTMYLILRFWGLWMAWETEHYCRIDQAIGPCLMGMGRATIWESCGCQLFNANIGFSLWKPLAHKNVFVITTDDYNVHLEMSSDREPSLRWWWWGVGGGEIFIISSLE